MLTFTLNQMLKQRAVIERNHAVVDSFGGEAREDWRELATVPCLSWWDKSSSARSASHTYVGPNRDAPISEGGMMLAAGTDVTEADRIAGIINADGSILAEGNFTISIVLNQQADHIELALVRAHLGA